MTVAELIEKLGEFPSSSPVTYLNDPTCGYDRIWVDMAYADEDDVGPFVVIS